MDPLDEAVDHVRGGRLVVDAVVYRGGYDTRSLLEALER
jgi:hypothetical protein